MDEFEQSDLGKETDDSHNTFYQNAVHYKEKGNDFIKNYQIIFPYLCYKTRGVHD